jgi:hypothetical protein
MGYYAKAVRVYGLQSDVTELISQGETIKQKATELGITVSEEEAREELKSNDLPVDRDYLDIASTRLISNQLLDEYFEPKTPLKAYHRESQAMFLESESKAVDIREMILTGEDFSQLASEYSLDTATKETGGYLGWHSEGVLVTIVGSTIPEDYILTAELGTLTQPVFDAEKEKNIGYWLVEVLKIATEGSHMQAMLLGSEAEAWDIRTRLEAGEDFAELANEYSQMPGEQDDGGDLGYITDESYSYSFNDFVFSSEVSESELSEPIVDDSVSTKGGYWLMEILAEETERLVSQNDRNALKMRDYYNWVSETVHDPANEVEVLLDEEMQIWAMEQHFRQQH